MILFTKIATTSPSLASAGASPMDGLIKPLVAHGPSSVIELDAEAFSVQLRHRIFPSGDLCCITTGLQHEQRSYHVRKVALLYY
jgi:hypothetical protein